MDYQMGYLLKKAQHRIRIAMDQKLLKFGVTTPQYAALTALEKEPGLSGAGLARRCFVKPQTMHKIISNIEKNEWIEKKPHPENNRVLQTYLTEQGATVLKQLHKEVMGVEERMITLLSQEEKENMEDMLKRCISSLEELNQEND